MNSTNEQSGAGSFSGSISDGRRLVNNDDAGFETQQGRKGFFNLTFYQQYFDVDTDQVSFLMPWNFMINPSKMKRSVD